MVNILSQLKIYTECVIDYIYGRYVMYSINGIYYVYDMHIIYSDYIMLVFCSQCQQLQCFYIVLW